MVEGRTRSVMACRLSARLPRVLRWCSRISETCTQVETVVWLGEQRRSYSPVRVFTSQSNFYRLHSGYPKACREPRQLHIMHLHNGYTQGASQRGLQACLSPPLAHRA